MKHVVSFSGGRTSAYLCKLIKDKHPDAVFVFMDTGMEHPKTYEFIKRVNRELELNLVCLRTSITEKLGVGNGYIETGPDDIGYDLSLISDFVKKYGVPYYPNGIHCTTELKNQPFYKYCNDMFGKGQYVTWIGIRADEPRRLNRSIENRRYLADISDFEKVDIIDFWRGQAFDLEIDEWNGNCLFCIHKKWSKLALVDRDNPGKADEFYSVVSNSRDKGKGDKTAMYQDGHNLNQVIKMFSDIDTSDLKNLVVRGKRTDTGSCTESCEPLMQPDMWGYDG